MPSVNGRPGGAAERLADGGERDIAVVGFAGRFPGARTVEQLWQNLLEARESITFLSEDELRDAGVAPELLGARNYVRAAPILEGVDLFDAEFFSIPPREARLMDPQHRLFLECSWEALEHAGFGVETTENRVGVFAGSALNTYFLSGRLFSDLVTDYVLTLTASDKDFLATRVAYKLDLSGPSMTVQTACSTSLVAVHVACQSLLARECDTALAGGVSVKVPQKAGYLYQEGGICAPDGHCRAFDAKAQGTIFGSGVGIVVLARLADALAAGNTIHAVIKGSAINNDGAAKVSYTAPSVERQAEAVVEALANAQVSPRTIGYVEAHGTGTTLGDPIEISALTRAFRAHTSDRGFCAIGSVKSNLGHLDAAAGVTSLIKAVHVVRDGLIPPSLHFESPNPEIDFAASPFFVSTGCARWTDGRAPRRAGINALGVGGTNVHVIIEQPPAEQPSGPSRPWQLLLLSAKTSPALEARSSDLGVWLADHRNTDFADIAYTLQVGRRHFRHRRVVIASSHDQAAAALKIPHRRLGLVARAKESAQVSFMFPGQGEIHPGAATDLYRTEKAFQLALDRCAEVLASELPCDLREPLLADREAPAAIAQLHQPRISQPAAFAFAYCLAQLWMSWGVRPTAVIGHSLGEFVAACLAGILSLEDALRVVATRGRLSELLPPGAMLTVPLSEEELAGLLGSHLTIAAVNGPRLCVVAGPTAAIEDLERVLGERHLSIRRLRVSHAFHSPMMDPLVDAFQPHVARLARQAPKIPLMSTVTGSWMEESEAVDPAIGRATFARRCVSRRRYGSCSSHRAPPRGRPGLDSERPGEATPGERARPAGRGVSGNIGHRLQRRDVAGSAWTALARRRRHRLERLFGLGAPSPDSPSHLPVQGQRHWIEASAAGGDGGHRDIASEPRLPGDGARQAPPRPGGRSRGAKAHRRRRR